MFVARAVDGARCDSCKHVLMPIRTDQVRSTTVKDRTRRKDGHFKQGTKRDIMDSGLSLWNRSWLVMSIATSRLKTLDISMQMCC